MFEIKIQYSAKKNTQLLHFVEYFMELLCNENKTNIQIVDVTMIIFSVLLLFQLDFLTKLLFLCCYVLYLLYTAADLTQFSSFGELNMSLTLDVTKRTLIQCQSLHVFFAMRSTHCHNNALECVRSGNC